MRIMKGIAALFAGIVLSACGGGGGEAGALPFGGDGPPPPSGSQAQAVQVVSSSNQLGTGGTPVTITAIVTGSGNAALASAPVSFSTSSGIVSSASATTDASGVATATLSTGGDKSNRVATVTVTSGTATGTIDVDVSGTRIAASGPATLQFGSTAPLSIKLTDSSGAPVPNTAIAVTSSLSNGLSATSVTTDALGNAALTYTATNAGSDSVQFSGVGATASSTIAISGENFTILTPSSNQTIAIGSPQTLSAQYLINGQPAVGPYAIRFASTSGTVAPVGALTGLTLTNGVASATVTASFAGPATLQATLVNTSTGAVIAQALLPVQFVATVPAAIVVQITPSSIGPNVGGSTSQQAQVRATVTDSNNNPVQSVTVNFSKDADPSGGTLSQASAVTDTNGQATVQYTSGALPSSSRGVILRATVPGSSSSPSISDTEPMTVNQSALFIALGTGNVISNFNETTYQKIWTVYVTDSSGAAVPNQLVTISVLPTRYRKGSFTLAGDDYVSGPWAGGLNPDGSMVAGSFFTCLNEDTTYDGIVTPAKDVNGNGRLEPGNVISVNSGPAVTTVTTDANGFALLNLRYAESYAFWVEVTLRASATVQGTESSNQATFFAVGLKSDYTKGGGPPAGLVSPFGERPSCTDPL